MTHSFIDGVLTLYNDKNERVVYPHHPEKLRPWASEEEALQYVEGKSLYFVPPPTVEDQRPQKLQEVNAAFEDSMNKLVKGYPEREISSWPQQEKEAVAYVADNTAPTPLLDSMAAAREIDKSLIVQKVVEKSAQYAKAAGALIGKRQALESAIEAATTLEELEAVKW